MGGYVGEAAAVFVEECAVVLEGFGGYVFGEILL